MGLRIERVDLPGLGVRTDVVTAGGRRLSVVSHRSGERDLALFDVDDPDSCSASIPLTDDEAAALAELLGASVTLSRLRGLGSSTNGLFTEEITVPFDSPFVGHPMGDTKARTLTGSRRGRREYRVGEQVEVTIVAIARGDSIIPSPGPETVLEHGDVLVAVGMRKGLDSLAKLIDRGPS